MSEQCVLLSKHEMPWVSWQLICIKFGFDPFQTKDVMLYCQRAKPNVIGDFLEPTGEVQDDR